MTRDRHVYRWWTVDGWWEHAYRNRGVKVGPLSLFTYVISGYQWVSWTWCGGREHVIWHRQARDRGAGQA